MNQIREYWYMGSMLASPEMQKKRIDECVATGLYRSLVVSISRSVAAAISCFAEISSERTFDEDRTFMAVSSSKIFPCRKRKHSVHWILITTTFSSATTATFQLQIIRTAHGDVFNRFVFCWDFRWADPLSWNAYFGVSGKLGLSFALTSIELKLSGS